MQNKRMIEFEHGGVSYVAYCPAAAVYDIYDKFGYGLSIAEQTHYLEQSREGYDALCWLLAELLRWGELWRRSMFEEPRRMLSVSELMLLPPSRVPDMQRTVTETLAAGFRMDEVKEKDETDLVLAEINAQRKKAPPQGLLARLTLRRQPRG